MLNIFLTEMRFILRQGKALALIITHPIIIGLLLYPILGGLDKPQFILSTTSDIAKYIPGVDLGSIAGSVVYRSGQHDVWNDVLSGRADVGLVALDDGNRVKFIIYYNPLRSTAATALKTRLHMLVISAAAETVSNVESWQGELIRRLSDVRSKISDLRQSLASAAAAADQARMSVEQAPDLSGYSGKIEKYRGKLGEYEGKVEDYRHEIEGYVDLLDEIEQSLEEAEQAQNDALSKLDALQEETQDVVDSIDHAIALVSSVRSDLDPDDPNYQKLSDAETMLVNVRNRLVDHLAAIQSARDSISRYSVSSYLEDVREKKAELRRTDRDLARMQSDLRYVRSDLVEMEGELRETSIELNTQRENLIQFLGALSNSARQATGTLASMQRELSGFTGIAAEDLPEISVVQTVHTDHPGQVYFPFILAIDIMMVAFLLPVVMRHRERDQGAELRLRSMRVAPSRMISGRYLAYFLVVVVQTLIIVLLGYFAGFVPAPGLIPLIIGVFLASAFLLSLGMLVAHGIQNTVVAFMFVILLEVVFVMFSGRLIPSDLMSPVLKMIVVATPLGATTTVLETLTLGGTAAAPLIFSITAATAMIILATVAIFDRVPAEV